MRTVTIPAKCGKCGTEQCYEQCYVLVIEGKDVIYSTLPKDWRVVDDAICCPGCRELFEDKKQNSP